MNTLSKIQQQKNHSFPGALKNFTLRNLSGLLIALLCINFMSKLQAQGINQAITANFDYPGLGTTYNDVGEDVAVDAATGNYYVVGEFAKDNNQQGIHIMKYNSSGTLITQTDFSDVNYKEYVKRVKFYSGNLYIMCNAVDISTGVSSLLAMRYSSNLLGFPSAVFFSSWHDPVDMVIASNSSIYVACYKRTVKRDELAVVKFSYSTTFTMVNSYQYHFVSITDSFEENPLQIAYNPVNLSLYVAGGVRNPTNGFTSTLAIKLNSSLVQQWVAVNPVDTGANVYNSVAFNGNNVYVAGSVRNGATSKWAVRKLNNSTGSTINSRFYSPSGYNASALKITFTNTNLILVVGFEKSASNTSYNIKIGKYAFDLSGTGFIYNINLTAGSQIRDAVSYPTGEIFITGSKHYTLPVVSDNLFFYGYDALNGGGLFYQDLLANQKAGGNRIVINPNPAAWGGLGPVAAVTGFTNINSSPAVPANLQMTTRFYSNVITKLASGKEAADKPVTRINPNPARDHIQIQSSEGIQSFSIYDFQGQTIRQNQFIDSDFNKDIDISSLAPGIYFICVNNGLSQKFIKN